MLLDVVSHTRSLMDPLVIARVNIAESKSNRTLRALIDRSAHATRARATYSLKSLTSPVASSRVTLCDEMYRASQKLTLGKQKKEVHKEIITNLYVDLFRKRHEFRPLLPKTINKPRPRAVLGSIKTQKSSLYPFQEKREK